MCNTSLFFKSFSLPSAIPSIHQYHPLFLVNNLTIFRLVVYTPSYFYCHITSSNFWKLFLQVIVWNILLKLVTPFSQLSDLSAPLKAIWCNQVLCTLYPFPLPTSPPFLSLLSLSLSHKHYIHTYTFISCHSTVRKAFLLLFIYVYWLIDWHQYGLSDSFPQNLYWLAWLPEIIWECLVPQRLA